MERLYKKCKKKIEIDTPGRRYIRSQQAWMRHRRARSNMPRRMS